RLEKHDVKGHAALLSNVRREDRRAARGAAQDRRRRHPQLRISPATRRGLDRGGAWREGDDVLKTGVLAAAEGDQRVRLRNRIAQLRERPALLRQRRAAGI